MRLDSTCDDDWRWALAQLAVPDRLDASAREHGALVRRREVRDAGSLLRLAMSWGPGGLSLRETAAWATAANVADLSDVALLNRLRGSADWLAALCGERLAERAALAPLDGARRLSLVDGTRIAGPGERAWRLHLCYDPAAQRFDHLELTDVHGAERLERAPVGRGEIRVADRCYARPEGLRHVLAAGGDLIVRISWKSLRLLAADGTGFDLPSLLAAAVQGQAQEAPVWIGKARDKDWQPLPMRLIVLRKPDAAALRSRRKARRDSQRDGQKLDPRTLIAADYILLLTSLAPHDYPADAIGALYRVRWQIELAIKRLKSILHIDRLPAKSPELARTWLYAHLLLALALDDINRDLPDSPPCAAA